jgi:hypothetical protein
MARLLIALLAAALFALVLAPWALAGGGMSAGRPVQTTGSPKGDGVHYLGYIPTPPGNYRKLQVSKLPASRAALTLVDLSASLPPIGDQGHQSSCTAWATGYYAKSWWEKQEHTGWNLADPTHVFSPSFVYNQINFGLDMGSFISSAHDLLATKGIVDIAEMPFNQDDWTTQPTAAELEAAKPYKIPSDYGYFWIQWTFGPYSPPNPIEDAKAWLASGKVLVLGIPIYNDWPDYGANPSQPYYDYNETAAFAGGHAVCICGYDDNANPGGADADHRGGFRMVNSWGPYWNGSSHGFLYLSYDFVKRYAREAWSMTDLTPDTPSIASLGTSAGSVGSTVVINGSNFGTKRRAARVSFNGVDATDAAFTNEAVTAKVPTGATSGPLRVYDWEGTASNAANFTVLPTLVSAAPPSGVPGAVITLSGTNFGSVQGSQSVSFGSVPATEYVSWSDAQIKCKVPAMGAGDVLVTVGSPAGTSNGLPFLVGPVAAPTISAITPASGVGETTVGVTDLAGTGFHAGATVRLERSGTVINAADVAIASATNITCKLNLVGALLGKYDVVVRNLDGQEARLVGGFSVTNVCGGGAGASLAVFGAVMGLLSLAGLGSVARRRGKRQPQ